MEELDLPSSYQPRYYCFLGTYGRAYWRVKWFGLRHGKTVKRGMSVPTPSMEDYLERIYSLIEEKGYARVSDIAEALEVHPSSVTKMVQKLDKDNYLVYEKYRGLVLTSKGKKVGKRLVDRHALLEEFLRTIGVDEEYIYKDVEGIEHHLSWESITCIEYLMQYFQEDANRVRELQRIKLEDEQKEVEEVKESK